MFKAVLSIVFIPIFEIWMLKKYLPITKNGLLKN